MQPGNSANRPGKQYKDPQQYDVDDDRRGLGSSTGRRCRRGSGGYVEEGEVEDMRVGNNRGNQPYDDQGVGSGGEGGHVAPGGSHVTPNNHESHRTNRPSYSSGSDRSGRSHRSHRSGRSHRSSPMDLGDAANAVQIISQDLVGAVRKNKTQLSLHAGGDGVQGRTGSGCCCGIGRHQADKQAHLPNLVCVSIQTFVAAFSGVLAVVVDCEVSHWATKSGGAFPVMASAVLKSIVSLTTVALLVCVWRYYRLKLATLKARRMMHPDATLMSSKFRRPFLFEMLVCALHVPPFLASYEWTSFISVIVFLRLYLIFRMLRFAHPLFRDKLRLAAIASFNDVHVDTLFIAKTLLRLQPFVVLLSGLTVIVIFGAYLMEGSFC